MKSIKKNTRLLAACIAMLAAATVDAAGIAFVTNVKGDASVNNVKLALMAELNRGQRIACTADCLVGVMYLQSGKEFIIKGPGEYLIGDTELSAKIGVPPAIRETAWRVSPQMVEKAQTSSASVRMRSVAIGKTADQRVPDALVYPVQTRVINLQPVFRWNAGAVKGPFSFQLDLSDSDLTKPVYKAKSNAMTVKLPSNLKLAPDATYKWSVSAGNKEIGKGSFQTLPASSMETARQRRPADKAEFADRLLYALTLQELGAEYDAQELLKKLAAERPDLQELMALSK